MVHEVYARIWDTHKSFQNLFSFVVRRKVLPMARTKLVAADPPPPFPPGPSSPTLLYFTERERIYKLQHRTASLPFIHKKSRAGSQVWLEVFA